MQIGIVGLGRMGGNIARRLLRAGHACVVHDRGAGKIEALRREGARGAGSLEELTAALTDRPAAVWLMLPAGQPTEDVVQALAGRMAAGDILVDGGNSHYRDAIRRAKTLAGHGIRYVDVGTSGGIRGLERGYCLMIGGDADTVLRLRPVFEALAPGASGVEPAPGREQRGGRAENGWLHVGPTGAGHFVKMVHNAIEYGLMQAYAEGFDLLRARNADALPPGERYDFDLADVAELWRRGSVISSWLLDLGAAALAEDPELQKFHGHVADSGEARWALEAAMQEAVPAPVLAAALFARFRSRSGPRFADRLLSALRHAFGGHVEPGGGSR